MDIQKLPIEATIEVENKFDPTLPANIIQFATIRIRLNADIRVPITDQDGKIRNFSRADNMPKETIDDLATIAACVNILTHPM